MIIHPFEGLLFLKISFLSPRQTATLYQIFPTFVSNLKFNTTFSQIYGIVFINLLHHIGGIIFMKKKLSLLTVGVCFVSLLTGCSSGSSGTYSKYVELGTYKGLEITKVKSEVSDDEVQEQIQSILEENSVYTDITDRGAKDGDEVNIDFKGTIDGENFDDNEAEDYALVLGEGYMLEDFEAGIIGMKVSETKNVTVTFPEDYDDALVGKEAVFAITLNSISEVEIPEYNDAFVTEISEFKTTAEYEADLKESLLQSVNEENSYTAGDEAVKKVIENSTFDGYPEELYDQCKAEYDETNAYYAEMFGMDVSEFELSEEDTKEAVLEMVNSKMVITTIAEKEKLSVSDEEYEAYAQENFEAYGYESIADFETAFTKEGIIEELLTTKVMNFLVENAKITEVSEEEYYQSSEDEEVEGDTETDLDDEILELDSEE